MFIFLFSLLLNGFIFPQIILTEVMVDPSGRESTDEFVELFNNSDQPVNLNSWQIGDGKGFDEFSALDGNPIIEPFQYALILDPDYFADSIRIYATEIPETAKLFVLTGSTFGSGGFSNSTAEVISLVNANLDTLQRFQYSVPQTSGFSEEKIRLIDDNTSLNWGKSLKSLGTPGALNSLSPVDFDLTPGSITMSPPFPVQEQKTTLQIPIHNAGEQNISGFHWKLQLTHRIEVVLDSGRVENEIFSGDTLFLEIPLYFSRSGDWIIRMIIENPLDQRMDNNSVEQMVQVDYPPGLMLTINEIMIAPHSGKGEWIELFNYGNNPIDLSQVFISDLRDTLALSDSIYLLPAQQYLVVGSSNKLTTQSPNIQGATLFRSPFLTLNNDGDQLSLLSRSGSHFEQFTYSKDWYGREVMPGVSLEKINPDFTPKIADNWAGSVDLFGSTPGSENSLFQENISTNEQLRIHPNPFSPNGDGHNDLAIISYSLTGKVKTINARIFDLRGREVKKLKNGDAAAATGQFVWNGKNNSGQMARIGVYICQFLARDEQDRSLFTSQKTVVLMK